MEIISKLWVFVSYCAETVLGFMCAVNKTDKSEERQNKKKTISDNIFCGKRHTLPNRPIKLSRLYKLAPGKIAHCRIIVFGCIYKSSVRGPQNCNYNYREKK